MFLFGTGYESRSPARLRTIAVNGPYFLQPRQIIFEIGGTQVSHLLLSYNNDILYLNNVVVSDEQTQSTAMVFRVHNSGLSANQAVLESGYVFNVALVEDDRVFYG